MNKHLITEEQSDYQRELQKNLRDFRDKLEPMVSTKKKHKRSRYRLSDSAVSADSELALFLSSRDRALHSIASARGSKVYHGEPNK